MPAVRRLPPSAVVRAGWMPQRRARKPRSRWRAGWSQICFSGFGPVSAEQRAAKQRYMQQIISAYYQRLMKENIWNIQEQPVVLEAQALTEWQPWLHIPDKRNQRRIVELWCKGKSAKEIAREMDVNLQYVYNLISRLRRQYPAARIPVR